MFKYFHDSDVHGNYIKNLVDSLENKTFMIRTYMVDIISKTEWTALKIKLSIILTYMDIISKTEWTALKIKLSMILTYMVDIISKTCLLYTSPSPRDKRQSRMPSSA